MTDPGSPGADALLASDLAGLASLALDDHLATALSCAVLAHGDPIVEFTVGRLWSQSPGGRQQSPPRAHPRTLFDLASVTKLFSTHTFLALCELGVLDLDQSITQWLPALHPGTTLRGLLTHTAGIPPTWTGWSERLVGARPAGPRTGFPADRQEVAQAAISYATALQDPPGQRWIYSCLGFNLAMLAAEAATGEPWDVLVDRHTLVPLGTRTATFKPQDAAACVATEYQPHLGRGVVQGVVHDEFAWALGGACANAGLFATASDVARLGEAIRVGRTPLGSDSMWADQLPRLLPDRSCWPSTLAGHAVGARIGDAVWMGDRLPAARGHTGFTGTSLLVDRDLGVTVVLLSNRVHPSREGEAIHRLRSAVHNRVADALSPLPSRR